MRVVDTESASRGTDVNHAHVSRNADLRSTSGLRYELEGYSKIEMRAWDLKVGGREKPSKLKRFKVS